MELSFKYDTIPVPFIRTFLLIILLGHLNMAHSKTLGYITSNCQGKKARLFFVPRKNSKQIMGYIIGKKYTTEQ